MPELRMPRLSDSMTEGTIIRWLLADGEDVAPGQEIVEIETDKATMSVEADAEGPLHVLVAAGSAVSVGAPIAIIGEANPNGETAEGTVFESPRAATVDGPAASTDAPDSDSPAIAASPVASRIADRLGVDLAHVVGSGPGGRIVKADVLRAAGSADAPVNPPADAPTDRPQAPAGSAGGQIKLQDPTTLQKTVVRRVSEARATVPDFSVTTRVDVSAAQALRQELKQENGRVPSLNDFFVAACSRALREHPRVNGAYRDGRFELYQRINIGIAVAAADSLVVPTIFDADQRSLGELAETARVLIERVRDRSITAAEMSGGTFTISNLGMYGVTSFQAIIHGGQAAILAVGAIEKRPHWDGRTFTPQDAVELTLVCDHRILYGADAAAFLRSMRSTLEQPLRLLL